jgi:outer membrane protein OmpU
MKKVLLATSALFLTAGVASAELTFSGKAQAGVIKSDDYSSAASAQPTANDTYMVYTGFDLDITASTTTDNGMTISATVDQGSGWIADIADKNLDSQSDTMGAPEVKVTYNGVTVELEDEGVQDYYDGDMNNYDLGISGAFGDLTYGVAIETNRNEGAYTTTNSGTATASSGNDSDYSYMVGYSVAGVSVSVKTNQTTGGDKTKIALGYTMGDFAFTATADNKGSAKDETTLKVAYTAGPAVISLSSTNDKDKAGTAYGAYNNKNGRQSWDLAIAYTTGAYTINASTNESDAWEADVAYDLGGGATMFVASDSNETSLAGVTFAF